jgi:hypothetical protein
LLFLPDFLFSCNPCHIFYNPYQYLLLKISYYYFFRPGYFCDEGDELWKMPDVELFKLAATKLEKIQICKAADIEDYIMVRIPKAYPVYMMGYKEYLGEIEDYLRKIYQLTIHRKIWVVQNRRNGRLCRL